MSLTDNDKFEKFSHVLKTNGKYCYYIYRVFPFYFLSGPEIDINCRTLNEILFFPLVVCNIPSIRQEAHKLYEYLASISNANNC